MKPVLDLTRYYFRRELGDITLYGAWIGEELEDTEPALVLVPAHRMRGIKPCCIALSSAYLYDDPSYMLSAAMRFNEILGFGDSMSNVHKVADIIHSHLQDLIEMPPKPVERRIVVGEATMTHESGRSQTIELSEDI